MIWDPLSWLEDLLRRYPPGQYPVRWFLLTVAFVMLLTVGGI